MYFIKIFTKKPRIMNTRGNFILAGSYPNSNQLIKLKIAKNPLGFKTFKEL